LAERARDIVSYPGGHNEGFADTSKQMFIKIYRHILNGASGAVEFPTFKSGARELVLCEKIVESAKEEAWIEIK